ncbi:MAG: BspA family leucine-rich repeat surface protein [Deltaproteobacteria bacterium]|nr:MAG: BspA family leucine-rich repeat surface protein [Deltaproteobacteria bacterium]
MTGWSFRGVAVAVGCALLAACGGGEPAPHDAQGCDEGADVAGCLSADDADVRGGDEDSPAAVERLAYSAHALPGMRTVGQFEGWVDPRTGQAHIEMVDELQPKSAAIPGYRDDVRQNRDEGDFENRRPGTLRFWQDESPAVTSSDLDVCRNFWTNGWASDGEDFRFGWYPEGPIRDEFLFSVLPQGGPGAAALPPSDYTFCTDFLVRNDTGADLRDLWILIDNFTGISDARSYLADAPRVYFDAVEGTFVRLQPDSNIGMFRYGALAGGPEPGDAEIVRRQWMFYLGDTDPAPFRLTGRLVELQREVCWSGNDDNGDGVADSGCGTGWANSPCYQDADCLSGTCVGGVLGDFTTGGGSLGTCALSEEGQPCRLATDCSDSLPCAGADDDARILGTCGGGPAPCTLPWGGSIASGASVPAFETESVDCGLTCDMELRECDDGELSGSFLFESCDAPACPVGYFVLSAQARNGNLGGLAGAAQACLAELNSNTWLGQEDAVSAGLLTADRVRPFLCSTDGCLLPQANTEYLFAAMDSSAGGASFTTDGDRIGPFDTVTWDGPDHFGQNVPYHTGMANLGLSNDEWLGLPDEGNTCLNWTTGSIIPYAHTSLTGRSGSFGRLRWSSNAVGCNTGGHRLICMVHPEPEPPIAPASCVLPWGGTLPHGESVTAWQEAAACNGECLSEERFCDDGVLSGSFRNETCTELAVGACDNPGYFVLSREFVIGGALGGLAGANASCLERLQNTDWLGKDDAGPLTADRVRAFLCDDNGCQDPVPDSVYFFAAATQPASGGAPLVVDSEGYGPNDRIAWTESRRFDFSGSYYTGRQWDDGTPQADERWSLLPSASTCGNWSDVDALAGTVGGAMRSDYRRWNMSPSGACGTGSAMLVCMVDPAATADGELGDACTSDGDCASGLCDPVLDECRLALGEPCTESAQCVGNAFCEGDPNVCTPVFVTVWDTTLPGVNNDFQIELPLESGGNYNFTVDWGDGEVDVITAFDDIAVRHNYGEEGIYTVEIRGQIEGWRFANGGDAPKLLEVSSWGPLRLGNGGNYFHGAENLEITAVDVLDLTGTMSLSAAFRDCTSLTSIPSINAWDVSAVSNLGFMFLGASNFNADLDRWDVLNVSNFNAMFWGASSFNGDVTTWNTANASVLSNMFFGASSFNRDIGGWTVDNVTTMNGLFSGASDFNQDLNEWNVSNVWMMREVFRNASSFNGDISDWNVSGASNMSQMFFGASAFNGDISEWNVSGATDMHGMFSSASSFNQDIGGWNVSSVTDMQGMFSSASSFDQDLGNWDISSVTNLNFMFTGILSLSTANYDALLMGWAALPTVPSDLTFHAIGRQYSSAAQAARDFLTNERGWTINDGGLLP